MDEKLAAFLDRVRQDPSITGINESATKQALILPILDELGWDVRNIREVMPEFNVGDGRVDYCLAIDGEPRVLVEAKAAEEHLDAHQAQLLRYAFERGLTLAALTNGLAWWLYLPLRQGSWEERKFFALDLREQQPSDAAEHFVKFLSRQSVASGAAVKAAEAFHAGKQRDGIIAKNLPKAWQKLVDEPDEMLVELLADAVERLCGYKPDAEAVARYLTQVRGLDLSQDLRSQKSQPPAIYTRTEAVRAEDDYSYVQPQGFSLGRKHWPANSFKNILLSLSNELRREHPAEFERALSLRGRKRQYFAYSQENLKHPRRLEGEPAIFVETNLSANSIVKLCKDLVRLFGRPASDFSVVRRSRTSPSHPATS